PDGFHRGTTADAAGRFQFSQIAPGSYTILARSVAGARAARMSAILQVDQTPDLTIKLSSMWVAFEDWEPPSDSPNRGTYLDTIRNATEVTRGQEGGNLEGYTVYAPRGNTGFNALGLRAQDNNFQIDSLDNNESWLRGPILIPPADAIAGVSFSEVYV